MDKSTEYISMCGNATEIQQQWDPGHGDFYVDQNGRVTCWVSNVKRVKKIKRGFGVHPENGVIRLTRYIWLPRLNQLIEMAQEQGKRFELTTQDFFDWVKMPYQRASECPNKLFPSLEQLWLAYVMKRKLGKIWNGSEWVTNDSPNGNSQILRFRTD
jgi:hypothetical protein